MTIAFSGIFYDKTVTILSTVIILFPLCKPVIRLSCTREEKIREKKREKNVIDVIQSCRFHITSKAALTGCAVINAFHLLFCISKIQNCGDYFLWNILFDKTTVTILSSDSIAFTELTINPHNLFWSKYQKLKVLIRDTMT